MPVWLLSPTLWKFVGIALLVAVVSIAAVTFVNHYHSLQEQAALVPGLQKANKSLSDQLTADDKKAGDLAGQLKAAYAQRDLALSDFNAFQGLLSKFGLTLNGIAANANATKNPVCLPTDAERSLFNTNVANFQRAHTGPGQPSPAGSVPASPR